MVDIVIFHYVKSKECIDGSPRYDFIINNKSISTDEIKFIEFAVSCLRARKEIENLLEFNPELLESSNVIPFTIINKEYLLNLKIFFSDNIITLNLYGEKIFEIHFEAFKLFTEQIYDTLNFEYTKNLFDLRILDPIYLEHMLGIDLPFFCSLDYDEHYILDLKVFDRKSLSEVSVLHHPVFIELKSLNFSETTSLPTNCLFESNEFRSRKILSNLMKNGYPYAKKFIILYNDEMIVRDGTHRLSCLYFLYGNIKIPVLRLKFSANYYSYSMFRKNRRIELKDGDKYVV